MQRKLMTGKFVLALAAAALLAFALTSCDNPAGGVNDSNISIFKNGAPAQANFDLWVYPYGGEDAMHSVQLGARIIPGTAYYQNASWSSSSPERATVSNSGYVTAVAAGSAIITATTATGRTASVTINVRGYEPDTESGDWSEYAGDLLILQAAAVAGGTGNNAHRTFVELYNRSDATINLDGLSLQWAGGQGYAWNVIPLEGDIPAGHSFLILGTVGDAAARLQLPDADADMLLPEFQLSNRAFRLALMEGIVPLTVHNPSDLSHDGTVDLRTLMPAADATEPSGASVGAEIAAGLIDLLGVVNTRADNRDIIHGAKGAPAYRISNQTSIRRANLDDATNNFNDFRGIDWQARDGAVADDQIAVFSPRNRAAGAWAPEFPEPNWAPPVVESDAPTSDTIIILQANRSGNNNGGGGGFPAALVELFNLTNNAINLTGYYLHFGSGTGTAADPATTWNYVIPLAGTIPARSSFLVVSGTDTNDVFRADLPVADQEADFILNAAANHWSVALMTRSTPFTGNPFTDEALWPYYVDMLGAGSNAASETASASTSQPQGPRRTSLVDTNNNGADFGQADFRGHWEGTDRTPNAELYRIWPRNSSAGAWNPITGIPQVHPTVRNPITGEVEFPAAGTEPPVNGPDIEIEPPVNGPDQETHAGDLLILQAAAVAGGTGNNAHRTFVELYNRSDATINLDGLSLQWADGQGYAWNVIPLEGNIPAGHSFLILGTVGDAAARLQLPDANADMLLPEFQLSNRAFRLALMEGIVPLTVHNPSDLSHDGTVDLRTLMPASGPSNSTMGTEIAAGLIDLLGVVNTRADNRDIIHGAKGAPAYRISNQTSIRRANLDDATNNFNDFRGIDWQARAGAVADDQIAVFIPRNRAAGAWTPEFPEPNWAPPPPPPPPEDVPLAERIIILQANRSGNDNGGGGGFQAALVELFNLTDGTINLAGYYLHFGSGTGTAADPATTWNYVVPLTGTIPARSSFLVVSRTDTNDVFRADLPVADQEADFILNATANHWSVALMTRSTPFTGNPFTDEALWSYYVDMLGAGSNAASETAFASTSQPQGPRRRSIVDTNNNGADFGQADFRGHWGGTARTPNAELYRIWPRNSSAGAWDPITGIPQVHPTVRNPTTDGEVEFPAP